MTVEERFFKYISIHTTSDQNSSTIPSTSCQFDLAKLLESEMKALGLQKVKMDEHAYVYGMIPAVNGYEHKKAIGFIAHLDTAPDFSGKNVKPQIIHNYDGNDVILSTTKAVIKVKDFPHLKQLKGRTLITTDGTTLLGADDKAGIANILTAMEELINSDLMHGDIWIAFTPDEEIGLGHSLFDLDYFKADYAFTVDGDYEGELAYENFNAGSAKFTISGINVHPGSAKNIMKNAASIACEIQNSLPLNEVPEHTEKKEGFYHLVSMSGSVAKAELNYIIRDHDRDKFEQKINYLHSIANKMNALYSDKTVTLDISYDYKNMFEIISKFPFIIDQAKAAMEKSGILPDIKPIRGGTDGARLSFRGLPCPNIGTGGYGFHGPFEHITIEGMNASVKTILEIVTNPLDK